MQNDPTAHRCSFKLKNPRMELSSNPALALERCSATIEKRFGDKITKHNDCWIWKASFCRRAGPLIARGLGTTDTISARRVSWMIYNGAIPDATCIEETCPNSKCVNPVHLKLITKQEIARRTVASGNHAGGPQCKPLHKNPIFALYGFTGGAEDRFAAKVLKTDGCWEWAAHRNECGYGTFNPGRKPMLANRVCWILHFGKIPDGFCVLHKCDNPACVRPDHLFLGTHVENIADMMRKGRNPFGERSGSHKLTEQKVLAIRKDHDEGMKRKAIALKHGTSMTNAFAIINRMTWKHI